MEKTIENNSPQGKKDSHKTIKYIIYILIVLIATALSLWLSLKDNFQETTNAIATSDWRYILIMVGIVVLSYLIDGLIIFVFCRLYTRRYRYHQGLATSLVGQFYSDVTPGASGGQVMQVYTLRSQGVVVSNAASIMVMWFILYQTALLIFDVVAFVVQRESILQLEAISIPFGDFTLRIPMIPLIIAGFLLNVSVILLLFTMSFWHGFHNFILHYVIGFLGKIHILKKPDETRESLRVQVENFKIELKRLYSNIPVVVLNIILFLLLLFCRLSIPYFAGMALHAWGEDVEFSFFMMMDASFLGAFHQMVTGLLPLPGAAGVSELFYALLFPNYFRTYNGVPSTGPDLSVVLSSSQILWRTVTFHLPLLVAGLTSALYRSRPKEPLHNANRKTFVALTMSTLSERQASADTMYKTSQMSRKALQAKVAGWKDNFKPSKKEGDISSKTKEAPVSFEEPMPIEKPAKASPIEKKKEKPVKEKKPRKKKQDKDPDDGWESWTL